MVEPRHVRIGDVAEYLLLSDDHHGSTTRSATGALDGVHVELVLVGLRADVHVWLSSLDQPLPDFFADLARHWRGWRETKEWRTYEGGLGLSCTHDGLGHVAIGVDVHHQHGLGWTVTGEVRVEAGQLDDIARDVRRFVEAG